MKNKTFEFLLFCCLILIVSCKKNCHTTDNLLQFKGKIKSVTEYGNNSTGDTSTFLYYYDSITSHLKSVYLKTKFQDRDTSIEYIKILKLPNDALQIIFPSNVEPIKYQVNYTNRQVNKIYKIDTISNDIEIVTEVFYNNSILDSIFDKGFYYVFSENINYNNFTFNNGNIISFVSRWQENITGSPIQKSLRDSLSYSNTLNTYSFPFQFEYNGGSIANYIMSILSIDGYYIIKPSTYLIDTRYTYFDEDYTTTYNYTFKDNKVTKVVIAYSNINNKTVRDVTYY